MPFFLDIPALNDGDGAILLPHAHAARVWRAQLTASPGALGQRDILAWTEWTSSQWARLLLDGADDRILLNRLQEEALWAEVIERHPPEGALPPRAIAELARSTHSGLQRAAAYRVAPQLRTAADTSDARLFLHWADLFLERCARDRLLPSALLEEALAMHLRSQHIRVPALLLVGFATLTPAQAHLRQAVQDAGGRVDSYSLARSGDHLEQRFGSTLPTEAEELRFAVRLIAERARAGAARTFALLSPEPARHRAQLAPLFRELLAPELGSVFADLSSAPWYFSNRPALQTVPAIGAAIDLLRWLREPLALERVDQLLVSPFFQQQASREDVARCRATLARDTPLRPSLDLSAFLHRTQGSGRAAPLPALRNLERAAEQARLGTGRRSHADWTEQIRRLLRTAGWPGPRTPSPSEFQAIEAWEGVLDRIATLGIHNTKPDWRSVLHLLEAETREQTTPSSHPDAPVQVLTLEEAEGLHFDLAVLLGASEEHLPAPTSRHPLLPQGLQRQLHIGDPADDLERTSETLRRLARRCGAIVMLASPSREGGEVTLSPLATALGCTRSEPTNLVPLEPQRLVVPLELVPEAATLPPLPVANVLRGAEVLRLQAACGFRAFTAIRLGAEEAPPATLGLSPRDSGSILHAALEHLWQQLGSQDALRALSREDRYALTTEATSHALQRVRSRGGVETAWDAAYLDVLQQRFSSLLFRWLDHELVRSPFRIRAQEQEQTLTLGPIRLQLRPDRVDEVEGGIALVDYKTSYELSSAHWLDDRPDAPQLPAYALAVGEPESLRGIAFAQIRPGQDRTGWISLSNEPGIFPAGRTNQPADLEEQLQQWRQQLTALAEAFAAGDASVRPKSWPKTCQYCAYRSVCRLDPETLLEQAPEGDEDTAEEEGDRG